MLELRPMVVNEDNVLLGGNMRLKALQHLKYDEIPDTWVKQASELTEDEQRRFIISDNVGYGEWDWEQLANEWNSDELNEWGLDVPNFAPDADDQDDLSDNIEKMFRIEVVCKDEQHQELVYNQLIEKGYECRLLTL